jgi:transcriptional regulator with XRE-family HTH domain
MLIGARLRSIREERQLSQGDLYRRTGLMTCYLSRIENGYTVPSVATLEKLARALKVPLYYFFYDGEEPPAAPELRTRKKDDPDAWHHSRQDTHFLNRLGAYLCRTDSAHCEILLDLAEMMASPARHPEKT